MKKLVLSLLVIAGIGILSASKPAEAQVVVYGRKCCDAWGNVRCYQINYTPLGSDCFCPGQGWGYTC